MIQERAHYIDLIRGICVIGIIFIHTCFHSGGSYVPMPMRSISLLLDVPAFFFISGMTMGYIKKDMIINGLFKLSMVFTLLSVICNLLFNSLSLSAIVQPLFLSGIPVPNFFHSVLWSYWFVPVFACTIILSSIIIKKFESKIVYIIIALLVTYTLTFLEYFSMDNYYYFGKKVVMILFPTACFLFGYWCQNNIVNAPDRKRFAVVLFIAACAVFYCCYYYSGNAVFNLQSNKFPFKLPYIAASFLSMAVFIFFYDLKIKNRFFEHLGKNAIFYYAGQGVSSSILFVISPHITLVWGLKLIIMFTINVCLAVLCSELLRLIYIFLANILPNKISAITRNILGKYNLIKDRTGGENA